MNSSGLRKTANLPSHSISISTCTHSRRVQRE